MQYIVGVFRMYLEIAYENPQIENPQIFANPLKIPKEGIENPHKFKNFKCKVLNYCISNIRVEHILVITQKSICRH